MDGWLKDFIAFVTEHSGWAYAAVFAVALLEAIPLAGSVVPGATVIIALSALVPDKLHWLPMIAAVTAGAVLGDGCAFWLGHWRQRAILGVWPLSRYPALIARSEDFFRRYGVLAVVLGRFISPIRAFVPITAGALGMPPPRFYPASIATGLAWAVAHVATGAIGADLAARSGFSLHHHGTQVALFLVILLAVSLAIRHIWRRKET